MCFDNFCYHLDTLQQFYRSDMYEICCHNENVVFNLFHGYMSTIGDGLVCDEVIETYFSEDGNFWVDYLIEDFLEYGYATVPRVIDKKELDFTCGIPLANERELYDFITSGILPDKNIVPIGEYRAIRRNSG